MSGYSPITLDSANVEKALNRAINAVKKPSAILKAVGIVAVQEIQENFKAQGRPSKWAPLSAATLHQVAGRTGRGKRSAYNKTGRDRITRKGILTATQALRRSITFTLDGTTLLVGTPMEYGAIHHFGFKGSEEVKMHSRRGKNGSYLVQAHSRQMDMPARPWLMFPDNSVLIRAARIALAEELKI